MIELPEDFRDLLIELADKALAAFGAPLQNFDVSAKDFATYDGILQIGLPPRRVDIINRADGISFEEAIAEGSSFTLEGRRIPVIGRAALIKNKRAAGRAQDAADVEVLAGQSAAQEKSGGRS